MEIYMKKHFCFRFAALLALGATSVCGQTTAQECSDLPSYTDLKNALIAAQKLKNGGLGFHMWATIVNRDGIVCAVAFSGTSRGDQWPGGSLFGLQLSNPVDTSAAYAGPASLFGQAEDPLVGAPIGGINVFGGGLA